ncbi:FKBP-type peptidyl-prolyl cis-trans isomerase [Rhodonellum sp.]|uniref:FKBP-type peptidyl-prolyl cis-trans isomerase n=1 Tax=Rhodonellum sp. TaxID=2231180 RepID=UPI0027278541|nr:FKBP-type peptidyl-prolyl cis-trans isomerase [Rhodonellum sp.]MDO9552701.1 FKBP-type peptidyl-prolyl cis-trans isomerase [Rhodonellum sp.]
MNKFSVFILLATVLFSGCVSEEENTQIIFERDLKNIELYLSENAIPSVKEFKDPASGLVLIWQEVSASGKLPVVGDTLKVDYVGKLSNNKVFDTSLESVAKDNDLFNANRVYAPLELLFGYGQVIPGFEYALSKMEMGDKATVIIPSIYGYGSQPVSSIPKNSILIFEIDLVGVNGVQIPDDL